MSHLDKYMLEQGFLLKPAGDKLADWKRELVLAHRQLELQLDSPELGTVIEYLQELHGRTEVLESKSPVRISKINGVIELYWLHAIFTKNNDTAEKFSVERPSRIRTVLAEAILKLQSIQIGSTTHTAWATQFTLTWLRDLEAHLEEYA